jgi:protein-serine/threonine kinase
MKVLKKSDMIKKNTIKRAYTEREILLTSKHPFIVSLYHCWHEKDALYFVMEYCQCGDLYSLLQKQKRLSEEVVKFYCAEILLALEYLHCNGYVYRDLKPENVLIHHSGHIKLTDFDLSKMSDSPNKNHIIREFLGGNIKKISIVPNLVSNSFVGTVHYLAPEMIENKGHGSSVDWWTFGILIYELLTGSPPFKPEVHQTHPSSSHGKIKFPTNLKISKNAKNMIRDLLNPNPKKRLGSKNGACDIKEHPFFESINWSLIRNQLPPLMPTNIKSIESVESVETNKVREEEECISDASSTDDFLFRKFKSISKRNSKRNSKTSIKN